MDSKQKIEFSGWVWVLLSEAVRASACSEGLFKEAKRVGDAGGAEGCVGDLGLSSTIAYAWLLVCGTLGRAETGGAGRKGEVGGVTGALGLCGEITERKSGLVGGDVTLKTGEGEVRKKGETRGEL